MPVLFVREPAGTYRLADFETVVGAALMAMEARIKPGVRLDSSTAVRRYLQLKLGDLDYEAFWIILLDAAHCVLDMREMFRGTLTETMVYQRELVKLVLKVPTAAILVAHNHPSGGLEPSRADELLTQRLKIAMDMVGVRVLDHFVVSAAGSTSFAERGLL